MKPTIDELHNSPNYELIESFHIDDMGKFLMRELGMKEPDRNAKPKFNLKTLLPLAAMLIVGGVFGWFIGKYMPKTGGISTLSIQFGIAFITFFIVLLPIHESIHWAAFKALGAEKGGFGWSKKSMIVYAYAQKFVMTLRENSWVAVMPFVVITALLVLLWIGFPQWPLIWGTALFLHSTACIGDFILIRYYFKNKHYTIYTYDDIESEKKSYFFKVV